MQDTVIYYQAHLDSYAPGLVGGNDNASADTPHLPVEIKLSDPEKQWWHATLINLYGRFVGQP